MSEQQAAEIERALATHSQDERVNALLDICVGRILKKDARRGNDWTQQYKAETIDHIVEWLAMACAEDAHWLSNMTPEGKPKKLLKFSKVQDVVKEADEFFRKRTANAPKVTEEDSTDEKTVFKLDGGYRIVQMLSTTALDREGSLMGHCVGSGGYDTALKTEREMFFSLRDSRNKPHVTMQVRIVDKKVLQARGKQNQYPVTRYAKMISAFSKQEGFDLSGERVGLAALRTPDGDVLDAEDLPEDRVVIAGHEWGYLALDNQGIDRWPRVVEVIGNVQMDFLANDGPEELIVHGMLRVGFIDPRARTRAFRVQTLVIEDSADIVTLPTGMVIEDSLLARGSQISTLPDDINLSGILDIRKTNLERLPVGISCGELLASGSGLTYLPERLSVRGRLDISQTGITAIPECLSCYELVANGSSLEALPTTFAVEGALDLRDTRVSKLPETLRCRDLLIGASHITAVHPDTVIRGDLLARNSKLRVLPRDLHVPGRLDLAESDVKVLPRGLFCGTLDISRTRVRKLPASLTVWGSLLAADASLRSLGEHEEFETLDVSGCPLECLPERLLVHGKLDISRVPHPVSLAGLVSASEVHANGTKITAFPSKLELQGGLYLKEAILAPLPEVLKCSELLLDDAEIDELPPVLSVRNWVSAAGSTLRKIHDLADVAGIVDLNGTRLTELPEGLNVAGSLWIEGTAIRHLPAGMKIIDDLRAAGSKLESLGGDIVIGRSANFTGTAITEPMIWDARLAAKNVFDLKGGWVSGYEPMQVVQGSSARIAGLLKRALWAIRRLKSNVGH
ncbi:PcfJ domain-containing protein [Agrobacterium salinitolerans]|nr:PcfJ domain-containing protein [Agrobacterium salinitolerans]